MIMIKKISENQGKDYTAELSKAEPIDSDDEAVLEPFVYENNNKQQQQKRYSGQGMYSSHPCNRG